MTPLLLGLVPFALTPGPPFTGEAETGEAGFQPLFDVRSLAGWVTAGGRYDGAADWRVEEGCIVGRQGPGGEGGLLYTEGRYTSFDLRLEVKLDHPFDSGVFLRMVPREEEKKGAQVTLDWREDGEIGAIYSDGYLQHCSGGTARFRRDDWNDLRVRCTGFDMRIEVWLNGEELTDFELAPGDPGEYAISGRIGVQVHGGREDTGAARFRNLRVKELPLFGEELFVPSADAPGSLVPSADAARSGWKPLFDGRSLAGWTVAGEPDRYRAADGVLSFLARGAGGELRTERDFRDFRLRLDFRIARMANSGLFLRAARDGSNPAFSGCEVQILYDFDWESVTGSKLKPWQFTGSLYGAVPPAVSPTATGQAAKDAAKRSLDTSRAMEDRLFAEVRRLGADVTIEPAGARETAVRLLGDHLRRPVAQQNAKLVRTLREIVDATAPGGRPTTQTLPSGPLRLPDTDPLTGQSLPRTPTSAAGRARPGARRA